MTVPSIDLDEFRQFGYLAEVNRLFFHPLGLALSVNLPDEGEDFEPFLSVLDDRSDPEGWYFNVDDDLREKRDRVAGELQRRTPARIKALGYVVQPLEDS